MSLSHTGSINLFRRYCSNVLSFRISSVSDIFQPVMSVILADIQKVICQMDDTFLHTKHHTFHDSCRQVVLKWPQHVGFILNEKCEFYQTFIVFFGNIIDNTDNYSDTGKIETIYNFSPPTKTTLFQHFFVKTNPLVNFTSKPANKTAITYPKTLYGHEVKSRI